MKDASSRPVLGVRAAPEARGPGGEPVLAMSLRNRRWLWSKVYFEPGLAAEAVCPWKSHYYYLMGERHEPKTHEEPAPSEFCECGIYAYNHLPPIEDREYIHERQRRFVVVLGWGGDSGVLHDEDHWRAQYARPVALGRTDEAEDDGFLEALAKRYDIPYLARPKDLRYYVQQFGCWPQESKEVG